MLYKYRAINTFALRILAARELYFAAPDAMNDPIDCRFPVPRFLDQVIAELPEGEAKDILSRLRRSKSD